MNIRRHITAVLVTVAGLAATSAAMAGVPHLLPLADAPAPDVARVLTRAPTDTDFGLGTRLKGTHFRVSGASGSIGVGLLLGPLGVAGNIAHVNEVNSTRAAPLLALSQIDVVQALRDARQVPAGSEAAAGTRAYDLLPQVQIRFEDDTHFHVGCLLAASLANGDKRAWRARYAVELPGSYDSQSQTSIDAAGQLIAPCLVESLRLFNAHVAGGMLPGALQPATILAKSQRQPFVAEEYPAHLILPDSAGLVEFADEAKVVAAKN